jgi:DNA-binding transcriptional LysR family regulator
MNTVHIENIDLNLLRVFDAVYRAGNVSRAAEALGLTQPAASHALTRLRLLLRDPLFVRAPGGVQPTPRADRLAAAVGSALGTLALALDERDHFVAADSRQVFRLHMSDIGEARFLPAIMAALREQAPGVQLQTVPLPQDEIAAALDSGKLSFAFGFLPGVRDTRRQPLLQDRYIVLLRAGHPVLRQRRTTLSLEDLHALDYAAVRSHSETLRILQLLKLEDRLRLTAAHFLALPAIVRSTELAVLMPRNIARGFAQDGGYALAEPKIPLRDFQVSLHWSRRFESDPANRWMRQLLVSLFRE